MKIFSSFVPNKLVITIDDSSPLWINVFLKTIKWKHRKYKTYIKICCEDSDYVSFKKK